MIYIISNEFYINTIFPMHVAYALLLWSGPRKACNGNVVELELVENDFTNKAENELSIVFDNVFPNVTGNFKVMKLSAEENKYVILLNVIDHPWSTHVTGTIHAICKYCSDTPILKYKNCKLYLDLYVYTTPTALWTDPGTQTHIISLSTKFIL